MGYFAFGFIRGQASAIAKETAEQIAEERLTNLTKELREMIATQNQSSSMEQSNIPSGGSDKGREASPDSEYQNDAGGKEK